MATQGGSPLTVKNVIDRALDDFFGALGDVIEERLGNGKEEGTEEGTEVGGADSTDPTRRRSEVVETTGEAQEDKAQEGR
jgi:hypothetical protein